MFKKLWNIVITIFLYLKRNLTPKRIALGIIIGIVTVFRYLKRNVTLKRVALGVNIGVAISILCLTAQLLNMFIDFDDRMGVFNSYIKREIEAITVAVIDMGTLSIENDFKQIKVTKGIMEVTRGIQDNIETINKVLKRLRERLALAKLIKIENIEDIKKANIEIVNVSKGYSGSGSHIKIGNKSYILTCAHLVKEIKDNMWAFIDKKIFPLELTKIDGSDDLALFRIHTSMKDFPCLKISDEYPTEGSEIVVIGNPSGLDDVITDGILSKERKRHYVFSNKVYFGNSGGAVLYKGKIVGVTSYTQVLCEPPVFVNYGVAIKLKVIEEFLKEFYE